jgi:hypothetical protein
VSDVAGQETRLSDEELCAIEERAGRLARDFWRQPYKDVQQTIGRDAPRLVVELREVRQAVKDMCETADGQGALAATRSARFTPSTKL